MPKGRAAEWLLARFLPRENAASIVGDLLESPSGGGRLRFWRAVGGVVLLVVWRRAAATLVAFVASVLFFGVFQEPIFEFSLHPAPAGWNQGFIWIGRVGLILWTMMCYSVVRYGVRDRFTQLAVVSVLALGSFIRFWWVPGVGASCVLFGITVIAVAAANPSGRRAMLALPAAVFGALVAASLVLFLDRRYERLVHAGPRATGDSIESIVLLTAIVLGITLSCSRVHKWLIDRRAPAGATN